MHGMYHFSFLLYPFLIHCGKVGFDERRPSILSYLERDVGDCLPTTSLTEPVHVRMFMRELLICVKMHISFCLTERHRIHDTELHNIINSPRYCGFYKSDIYKPNFNLNIRVVTDYGIVMHILYFNLQWSDHHCSEQGVILAANTTTRLIHCGKRLPWQYIHKYNAVLVTMYGFNSRIYPSYLNLFYSIIKTNKVPSHCERIHTPTSLIIEGNKKWVCRYLYIIADFQYAISVVTYNATDIIMFDGPGKKSPFYQLILLSPLESSSSQLVIYASNSSISSGTVFFRYIHQFNRTRLGGHCFSSVSIHNKTVTPINVQFVNNQSNYVCHHAFHGSETLKFSPFINITTFSYEGPTVHTETLGGGCQYGGMYFYTKTHTDKEESSPYRLRMAWCGNVGHVVPPFVAFAEDLILGIVFYKGYSSGVIRAEGRVLQCAVDALSCGVRVRKIIYLPELSACSIFHVKWRTQASDEYNCLFVVKSSTSRIIGPARLSISNMATSITLKKISARASIYIQHYNDWPHSNYTNKELIALKLNDFQSFERNYNYVNKVAVKYTGAAQEGRFIMISVIVASCLVQKGEDFDYSMENFRIISYNCGELENIVSNHSTHFIYAPAYKEQRLTIWTKISSQCHGGLPPYTLHVVEYNAVSMYKYNYIITDTAGIKFISKFTGTDLEFFFTSEMDLYEMNRTCHIKVFVEIDLYYERPMISKNGMIQENGRKLYLYNARSVSQ